jgi:DNA-binding transcriptional MerR regulator
MEQLYSAEEVASSYDVLAALRKGDPADPRFETAEDPRIPIGQSHFKIGQVAQITGIKPYVLRYWEGEFPFIRPPKTSSRQRRYRREDIALLLRIGRLRYEERLTIDQTRQLIREGKRHDGAPRVHRRPTRIDTGALKRALGDMRKAVLELLETVEE